MKRIFPSVPDGRTGVKICGVTRADQAGAIVSAGADAIGVNFWPRSKRYLPLAEARPWLAELAGAVVRVGVFVNATDEELRAARDAGCLDFLQLHGDETPERLAALLGEGLPVFKAAGLGDRAEGEKAAAFPGDSLLLDAHAPSEYGGTGRTADWSLAAEAVQRQPEREIVLAGGLSPENVAEAVARVASAGVDTASGVESAPGVKDLAKVRDFLAAARDLQ